MPSRVTPIPCTADQHLRHNAARPTQEPEHFTRKPPQSARQAMELCSSFLAERGCLHRNESSDKRGESAA